MSWDPFKDFDSILKQFTNIQQSLNGNGFSMSGKGSWLPLMDVTDTDKGYRVTADLPGVNKDDIDVIMESNRLCISGTRPLPDYLTDEKSKQYRVFAERGYGRFERCIQLPQRVVEQSMKAAFVNGVLDVTMDKSDTNAGRSGSRVSIE